MKVKISDIKIGERFRKDLGNLQELADSIKGVGLLHPIVVNQDNELIAGARRLTACQQLLDWTEIDTTVVKLDNNNITRAELDENTIRQDFSFSERLAILQEIENQRSKLERNSNAKDKGKRSAEIAADLTNISPAQLYKEKKLFETLKSNPRLSYLVGELDRGDITVNRACNMIDEAKEEAESIRTLFGINGESMRKPGRHMV